MKFLSHSNLSQGLGRLCASLGAKKIKHEGRPIHITDDVVCWGNVGNIQRDISLSGRVLNFDTSVARNKLKAFRAMEEAGVSIPEFTTSLEEVIQKGGLWLARATLTGSGGEGIVLFHPDGSDDDGLDPPIAPLYVKYIPKKDEYRYHVFNGRVFYVQKKARSREASADEVNWKIRNHSNGFVFVTGGVTSRPDFEEEAIKAVRACGVDFGAVDLIYNERRDKCYILEINTAPGLEATTVDKYVEVIEEWTNER